MKPIIFTLEQHPEYGIWGWRQTSRPWMEPLYGVAVAHDSLEHFPNDRGALGDEWQALGASIRVRWESPAQQARAARRRQDLADLLAGDITADASGRASDGLSGSQEAQGRRTPAPTPGALQVS